MGIDRDRALSDSSAAVGAIEDRQMLGLQMRRSFDSHRAAAKTIARRNLLLRKAERLQHIEVGFAQLRVSESKFLHTKGFSKRKFIERELNFEGLPQAAFQSVQRRVVEPFQT